MRQVIDGKVFDTETAQLLGTWTSHHYANDFHHHREELYRTPKGTYFLAGQGGARSPYAEPVGDGMGPGSRIVPLTEEEARAWAEAKLPASEYLALFTAEEA